MFYIVSNHENPYYMGHSDYIMQLDNVTILSLFTKRLSVFVTMSVTKTIPGYILDGLIVSIVCKCYKVSMMHDFILVVRDSTVLFKQAATSERYLPTEKFR